MKSTIYYAPYGTQKNLLGQCRDPRIRVFSSKKRFPIEDANKLWQSHTGPVINSKPSKVSFAHASTWKVRLFDRASTKQMNLEAIEHVKATMSTSLLETMPHVLPTGKNDNPLTEEEKQSNARDVKVYMEEFAANLLGDIHESPMVDFLVGDALLDGTCSVVMAVGRGLAGCFTA